VRCSGSIPTRVTTTVTSVWTCASAGSSPRIARCGVEPKNRLGRYRWVVERTLSWLNRFRRLKIRYEHRADIHLAFLQLGCALSSLRFLG
jgi:DDE family transposase